MNFNEIPYCIDFLRIENHITMVTLQKKYVWYLFSSFVVKIFFFANKSKMFPNNQYK